MRWVTGIAVLLACAAGCTAAGESDVSRTASEWLAAAGTKDAARMCALLTPAAAESVATSGKTCEQGIGDLDLPAPGPVGTIELWSDQAQVRAGTDTLFLVRLNAGWRVNAAGCTPRGDRPYDCDVAG